MADYFVYCHTPDNYDLDRRIQGLGSYGPGGTPYWHAIDEIIAMIRLGDRFFINVQGVQTLVVVRQHHGPYGRDYLTTIADGFPPNNILRLPVCGR